jgi:Peptidase family M49
MMRTIFPLLLALSTLSVALAYSASSPQAPDRVKLQTMANRFAPVDLGADISGLPPSERQALSRLLQAAWIVDGLFLRQVWAGNETMLLYLLKDDSPLGQARLRYFLLNKGPWSRLDDNEPFLLGLGPKPSGANYYPAGAAKEEIEAWFASLPDAERVQAAGFFTTIRRPAEGRPGSFVAVPYSMEYQGELAIASRLLRDAARLTNQPTLKAFLTKRADAFLSDNYYESDLAWMELDATIEPTIGPYEVYEDALFNAKAAFEAFITIKDEAETARLTKMGSHLQDIENHLPIEPAYRNPRLGALAPIRVVNEILATGDAASGVQTVAFNLPNDERIIREKGSKRVMLRNVQEAKFKMVLVPIARLVLPAGDQNRVSFDAFFAHTLMHELMHGLGPHEIRVGGRATTVRQELKETYSVVEEAKADISGLFALQYLVEKGVVDRALSETMYSTFLASAFRSIRFGIGEAHGGGTALQLNYLLDRGAFRRETDGMYSVDRAKIVEGVTALTREIMTLEAEGNYSKAKDMLARLAVIRPEVQQALDRLHDVPVDIAPRFITAAGLVEEKN